MFSKEPITFPFPIVSQKARAALEEQHARATTDYEQWKRDFLEWLHYEGRNPDRLQGYAKNTIRETHYKTDKLMMWLWEKRDYTTELTPDDADQFMKEVGRYSEWEDTTLLGYVKTIKRIFSYFNHERGKHIEWDCDIALSEPKTTNRDYFKKDEFRPLYEAALEYGTVKHYNQCTPYEREQLKVYLSQRFEFPKDEVTPKHFARANSFKIPSIVSVSLDVGLRPIEVGRATIEWVNFEDGTLDIPKEESTKSYDNWQCVLSQKSLRALENWISERSTYEKYEGRDELWLTQRGNPYSSNSLNYLLNKLITLSGTEPAGRELTWYSIRHGVATIWADDESLHDAREQLRHKNVETTLRYTHSAPTNRHNTVNSKW